MIMYNYKIESYVPEKSFLSGKDARFCRAAFEDCFVIDLRTPIRIIASCRENNTLDLSMADMAALLMMNGACDKPLMLPCPRGTLLIYPAWQALEMALAFLFKDPIEKIEKAYQNAQRYAFSMIFDTDEQKENSLFADLENKLCVLQFYMRNLFGKDRQVIASAHVLMLANLVGCQLHEMSVLRANITLNESELEKLGAFLACTFMTMRRYNGSVLASPKTKENTAFLPYVEQKYGICIEQSMRQSIAKTDAFSLPSPTAFANFITHPVFANYRIEESDGSLRLHIPLNQKAILSSFSARRSRNEMVVLLFPIN